MLLESFSIVTLSLTIYTFHLSIGPPPPAVPKEQLAKDADIIPVFIPLFRFGISAIKSLVAIILGAEALALLILSDIPNQTGSVQLQELHVRLCSPFSITHNLCPYPTLPPRALLGCFLCIAGALLRIKSQRSLGPLFTWEVSIRPSHKLITNGPYAFVRHPSYTGSIFFLIGEVIFATSRGTLLSECVVGYYPRVAFYGGLFCLFGMTMGAVTMINRTMSEDDILRKEFGKEWDEWATKVKYRLFPGVF